jgi:hypothetical protein
VISQNRKFSAPILFLSSIALPLLWVSGCKTASTSRQTGSKVEASGGSSVCCARSSGRGTFYKTKSCGRRSNEKTLDCCARDLFGFDSQDQVAFYPFPCDEAPAEYLTQVSICHGPTRFRQGNQIVGGISDAVSGLSHFAHVWIRTSHMEIGMGPKVWETPGADSSPESQLTELFDAMRLDKKVTVAWRDHTGYSDVTGSGCTALYFCDEACVEKELQVGKSLGFYTIINQCQSSSVAVLRKCGCMDHCTKWLGGLCTAHAFPPLKGFNLEDESVETPSQPD